MSNTPRTDERSIDMYNTYTGSPMYMVPSSFSRQIELELNAAKERIKRLEDALVSIREYWNRDKNQRAMVDACWYAIDKSSEALEAKEAKP